MTGSVGILNVGAGDTKLTFDKNNPAEMIRAARIVRDMLRRGYALLVEVTGTDGAKAYRRAKDFDEATCEYIIADFDPVEAEKADAEEIENGASIGGETGAESRPTTRKGRPPGRVAASGVKAVAVARTAGG